MARNKNKDITHDGPLLEVKDLRTGFKLQDGSTFVAVDGVSFDLQPGRALAIVGESGSGKSVSMRSLLQLLPKNGKVIDGQASFVGKDLVRMSASSMRKVRGREIGMIFQNAMEALNPTIRVGKQLCEALLWHGLANKSDAKKRAIQMLGDVGIPEPEHKFAMYPFQFSGGMRQRAMIAQAIIADPKLVIADEPTTALDVTVQKQVLDLLADIKNGGTSMIMITHDLGVARYFCDDMIVMNDGKVVEAGSVQQILDDPQEDYTRMLLSATLEVGNVDATPHLERVDLDALNAMKSTDPEDDDAMDEAAAPHLSVVEREEPQSPEELADSESIILASHLHKIFNTPGGDIHAVKDVSFKIQRGETLGLVGESGSGKSTVARIVMGLHEPDEGTVLLDGTDVHGKDARKERRRMQMVFQNPFGSLIPHYTAGDNIIEALRLQNIGTKAERVEKSRELLRLVGMSPDDAIRYPQQFSGGQQQRIAVARALAPDPDVLVCDEPTSSLDVSIQAQILDLLNDIQDRLGLTMLLISHNLAVVEKMSNNVAVMRHGSIVEQGTKDAVYRSPEHPYTMMLLDAILPVTAPAA